MLGNKGNIYRSTNSALINNALRSTAVILTKASASSINSCFGIMATILSKFTPELLLKLRRSVLLILISNRLNYILDRLRALYLGLLRYLSWTKCLLKRVCRLRNGPLNKFSSLPNKSRVNAFQETLNQHSV